MQQDDFLDELGVLALGTRLKRLSERMLAEAAAIYKAYGIDLQTKHFSLLALLHHNGAVTIVEAAEKLGISQPAISQFVTQLKQQGLIDIAPCEQDARRRMIQLSDAGKQAIEDVQPLWQAVTRAAGEINLENNNDLLSALQKCEQALQRKSMLARCDIDNKETKHG